MMSVFTFMGANIMRQDDAYSFHIISKILETVIPALITVSIYFKKMSLCDEKTNNLDSDQVRHKPGCTVTEDG